MQSPSSLTLPPVFLRARSSDQASLSRHLQATTPSLVHTLIQEDTSILSVATGDNYIYSGSQNQHISVLFLSFISTPCSCQHVYWVWDSRKYTLKTRLRGHTGSVLALEYASDQHWLFSSSGVFRTNSVHYIRQSPSRSTGDSTVRVSLPSRLSRPALSHTRIKQVWCTKSLTP